MSKSGASVGRADSHEVWRIVDTVAAADEIPAVLQPFCAVVVMPGRRPTWIAFDCPCVARHRIMLNLDSQRYPRWRIARREPLTISPSVLDHSTGSCHFLIRGGRTVWVTSEFEGPWWWRMQ